MEYNNIYEVDLAILHAVSGGTPGGGITSGQVETMIDSALTDYSTTQEVEAMIQASGSTGGGKTPLYLPWNRQATSAETQAVIDLMAECRQIHEASGNVYTLLEKYEFLTSDDVFYDTSGFGSPSIRYDYGDGSNPGLYVFFPKFMYQYGENSIGSYWFTLREDGGGEAAYWDISSSINRCVWSQNQQVQTIQYCTQAEYDAEGQQYGHDASRLYLIVPQNN